MGITDLWSILSPGFDTRISFPIFVSEFIDQNGRTPRIAIDAYMLIFQSNHSNVQSVEREDDIQLRNIMSKLMYLTLLNISYVVVFDGRYKPQKVRHNEEMCHNLSYDDQLNRFQKIKYKNENYIEDSLCAPLIKRLNKIFRANEIDFIQSPGEAEAECAMLQKFGVVDYVLTKDTDVFVFGASKVLRNFSRSEQDIPISSTSNTVKDYYVTPVDMAKISKETGLDYQRLILIATLRGGDYSNGMKNIGITRAVQIALCGTKFATFFHLSPRKTKKKNEINFYEPLPDFSKLLVDCFINRACLNVFDPFNLIKDAHIRKMELENFTKLLNQCIKSRSRDIFDMDLSFSSNLFIDEYFTLLYLFPIVSPQVFKFVPRTLSFGEVNMINNDLSIPESCIIFDSDPRTWIESVPRFNNILDKKSMVILEVCLHTDELGDSKIINCTYKNSQVPYERHSKYIVPDGYNFNIKNIIIKLISCFDEIPTLSETIKITNKKFINHTEFLMLKFESEKIKKALNELNGLSQGITEGENENEKMLPSKNKLESLWLPKNLVGLINPKMVRDFEMWITALEKEKIKQSQRKYKTVQRTTLDNLGLINNKYEKNEFGKENNSMNIKATCSPRKRKGLLKIQSKKHSLLPGQSLVTSFFPIFKHSKEDNPFMENEAHINESESLFVNDMYECDKEIQKDKMDIQCDKLKLDISLNTKLSYEGTLLNEELTGSPKRRVSSLSNRFSSPQSSPCKRLHIKEALQLSPDSSPMKQHTTSEPNDAALLLPALDRRSSFQKTTHEVTFEKKLFDIRDNNLSTVLDTKQTSDGDSDSDVDSSSLMEINFNTFQKRVERTAQTSDHYR